MRAALRALPIAMTIVASTTLFIQTASAAITPPVDLRSSACPANIVEYDTGSCVVALQDILWNWGFQADLGPSGANGQFGPDTEQAVKAFQTLADIGVDGQVGPQTKAALYSVGNGEPTPFINSSGIAVASDHFCLDADLNTRDIDGQKVQGWTCNLSSEQKWTLFARPNGLPGYMVLNMNDFECLDASGAQNGVNGQKVQGWACNGSANQVWELQQRPQNTMELINAEDGHCLDADTNTANMNGQVMQTWTCNGSVQQEWYWSNSLN